MQSTHYILCFPFFYHHEPHATSAMPQDILPAESDSVLKSAKKKALQAAKGHGRGLMISRRFTTPGTDPLDQVKYALRTSRIVNTNGSVVFEMKDAEVPAAWSQVATDIVVSKYFRKAGVPQFDTSGRAEKDASGNIVTGPERSVKQVVCRLAGCWRTWGEKHGYLKQHKTRRPQVHARSSDGSAKFSAVV
jgi:hypothetical protein